MKQWRVINKYPGREPRLNARWHSRDHDFERVIRPKRGYTIILDLPNLFVRAPRQPNPSLPEFQVFFSEES